MKKQMVEILEKFFLTYFLAASLIFSLDSASSFSTKILRIDFQIDSKRFLRLSFVFFILGLRLFLPRLISFTKKMIDRIQRINLLMFLIGLSGLLSLCLPVFHPFLFILMFIIMLAGWLGVNFVNEAGSEEKPTEKDFSFRLLFRLLCLSLVFYGWFIFVIKKATIAFSLFSERPWFNNFAGGLMSLEITGFLFFLWFASVLVLLGLLIFNRKKISFSRVGTAEKRSRMLILTVIFMAAFLVRLRASSFNSHFPDSFIFPLVAVNMVENGILSFGWKTLPAVNINSYLPSGRLYFRGILFSISQAVVFKLFGPTDFTARLPGILFGSFSVLLLYFIARRAADKKTALLASLLMAFSGWEVYMSTFIRHYVLHTAFFLLIIYLYFSYQEKKIDYRFFLFCLALSLWSLVHVQAFMLFCPLLLLIFINTFIRNDGRRKFFLRALNLVLIFSVPFFLLFNPWPQTRTAFIQFAAYHFSFKSWILSWTMVLLGSLLAMRSKQGLSLNILFYLPFLSLSLAITKVGRIYLIPEYTAVFFPIFLLYLSIFLCWLARSNYWFAGAAGLFFCLTADRFLLPYKDFSQKAIRPLYYNYKLKQNCAYSVLKYRYGFEKIIKPDLEIISPEEKIVIVNPFPQSLDWYSRINIDTREERVIPLGLEMKKYEDRTYFDAKTNQRFSFYCNIPVITTARELNQTIEEHKRGYIIVSQGGLYRLDEEIFFELVDNHPKLKQRFQDEDIYIYSWGIEGG